MQPVTCLKLVPCQEHSCCCCSHGTLKPALHLLLLVLRMLPFPLQLQGYLSFLIHYTLWLLSDSNVLIPHTDHLHATQAHASEAALQHYKST